MTKRLAGDEDPRVIRHVDIRQCEHPGVGVINHELCPGMAAVQEVIQGDRVHRILEDALVVDRRDLRRLRVWRLTVQIRIERVRILERLVEQRQVAAVRHDFVDAHCHSRSDTARVIAVVVPQNQRRDGLVRPTLLCPCHDSERPLHVRRIDQHQVIAAFDDEALVGRPRVLPDALGNFPDCRLRWCRRRRPRR